MVETRRSSTSTKRPFSFPSPSSSSTKRSKVEATSKAHQLDPREEAAPGAEDRQVAPDPLAAADPPRGAGHASPEQEKRPEDGAGQSSELQLPTQEQTAKAEGEQLGLVPLELPKKRVPKVQPKAWAKLLSQCSQQGFRLLERTRAGELIWSWIDVDQGPTYKKKS